MLKCQWGVTQKSNFVLGYQSTENYVWNVGHKIAEKSAWGRHGCHRNQVPSTLPGKTVQQI